MLKDSEARARYLLELNGVKLEEGAEARDSSFLMKVFEMREEIDDAVAGKDLVGLQGCLKVVEEEISALCDVLAKNFSESTLDAAYDNTVKLIYFKRMHTEIAKHMPAK